jgi:cob(I)alamin adenosyltransferase
MQKVMEQTYIQVYTGNSKGKTTAGLGLAIRAHGHGLKPCIIFFDKGGDRYGERTVLKQLGIEFYAYGRDRIDAENTFDFSITKEDISEVTMALDKAREKVSNGEYDLVVLDEINVSAALNMCSIDDVINIMNKKHPHTELVLTGRNAHERILERADLVTEMKLIKHYFTTGQIARQGIEY